MRERGKKWKKSRKNWKKMKIREKEERNKCGKNENNVISEKNRKKVRKN